MLKPSKETEEIALLLGKAPVVHNACDLDLMGFLHRHPRTVLTSEQIAGFVGYPMNQIAESLDRFIAAGVLERTQNTMHAARMYLLKIDGPQGDPLKTLLNLASTRHGRRRVIDVFRAQRPGGRSKIPEDKNPKLRVA